MVHIIHCKSIECINLNCFQQLPCVRYNADWQVDSDRESAADDVENGDDTPSDATLGEGTPVIPRRSGRQSRPHEWLRSRDFVLAKPEGQRNLII